MIHIQHKFRDKSIEKVISVRILPDQRAAEVHIKPNYDMVRFTEADLLMMLAMIKVK